MASGLYQRFKSHLMKKLMDLVNDTVKVALYGSSFAFTDTQTVYSVSQELLGVGGYTAGGAAAASQTVTEGGTGGGAMWDFADSQWTSATFSTYFAVIYDQSPCNTLICAIDFGGVQTVTSGTFTIVYASSGVVRLT